MFELQLDMKESKLLRSDLNAADVALVSMIVLCLQSFMEIYACRIHPLSNTLYILSDSFSCDYKLGIYIEQNIAQTNLPVLICHTVVQLFYQKDL